MQAVRLVDGAPRVVDVAPPEPGPGWVRVRVRSAGICASDLHLIDSGFPVAATLGHEIAGITDDGTPVAIEPIVPCGACGPCSAGAYHLCDTAAFTMIGIGTDGGMAEQLVVPERSLVALPAGIDLADASLVEPLAVAVHGLRLGGHTGSTDTAVVGAGTIGLAAIAAASHTVAAGGGGHLSVLARHDHQRAAAEALGASVLDDPADEASIADLVIEAAGTADAFAQAAHLVRPGGTIVLLSIHWSPTPTPGVGLWLKEARVVPAMTYGAGPDGRDIDHAAEVLATSPEVARAMITHRRPLGAATDAFDLARQRSGGVIKVVLEP